MNDTIGRKDIIFWGGVITVILGIAVPIITYGVQIQQIQKDLDHKTQIEEQTLKEVQDIKILQASQAPFFKQAIEDIKYIRSKQNGVVYIHDSVQ